LISIAPTFGVLRSALLRGGGLTRRAWVSLVLGALLSLLVPATGQGAESAALEYKVKAGYLFNFAKFIEWPASALPAADSPFIIAVLDAGEAVPVLEPLFAGKNVNGHPVQVKAVSAASLPKDAHILLVTRAAGKTPEEIREALGDGPTLLVGETEQFAERGGTIAFVREEESVRLTLCLEHAASAGLKVSAKLSNVAKPVKSKRKK
jgi:YfiR/HmsC-like